MIIDGKKIAKGIYDEIKNEVSKMSKKPILWAILVWEDSSSLRYVEQKRKWSEYTWIGFEIRKLNKNVSEKELHAVIKEFNESKEISGFIVQLPLPKHINTTKVINAINPRKDVDWFHPTNQWKVLINDTRWFIPCTPAWIMEIFKKEKINLEWKVVCVVWRSNIVWKPVTALLINAWATVTSCNSMTKDIKKYTSIADIVVVAAWKPGILKVDMIKHWTTVIDVWFTVVDWKILWDADTKLIDLTWNKITPVPGWVWALTVSMLMKNTLKAYKLQK